MPGGGGGRSLNLMLGNKLVSNKFREGIYKFIFCIIQSALGQSCESYFVESEAKDVQEDFRKQLAFISRMISKRNETQEQIYDRLLPDNIPNSESSK